MTETHITTSTEICSNPDADLLAMIERHDALWAESDRDIERDPMNGSPVRLLQELCDLEVKIVATPAFTRDGLAGKRRVAKRADLESQDDLGLVETIFELDAERIAAR